MWRGSLDNLPLELLRTTLGSMTDGMIIVDSTGQHLFANRAGLLETGFVDDTMPERSEEIVALWPDGRQMEPADRPSVRAFAGETVTKERLIHRGPRGDRLLDVDAIPLDPDPVHGHARVLVLFHDVTEEHAARAELTAFANVVAHDLRSPLTSITGWTEIAQAELAETGALSPELAGEVLGRLRAEADRMAALIEDLHVHAVSRDRTLEIAEVDLNQVVEEVVSARRASDHVTVGPLPTIWGDRVLLRQVVDNLVGNGLKFVAPGDVPELHISAVIDRARLTLRFADHGIGVPDGAHREIFGEFRRFDRAYPGTGLGLAIVKRAVERHQGTVVARPGPERGTVIEIVLPASAVVA